MECLLSEMTARYQRMVMLLLVFINLMFDKFKSLMYAAQFESPLVCIAKKTIGK